MTKSLMKIVLAILLSSISVSAYTQSDSTGYFFLSISTYNHADRLMNGTMTYELTNSQIIITNRAFLSENDDNQYTAKIDTGLILSIKNLELNKLDKTYYNNCVMITSGDEYFVSINFGDYIKRIHLHHYYLKTIEDLVKELNRVIPDKFKIRYVSKETEQDCE